ncbi:hypothetical protein FRC10_010395 [Ceratobasidium sp. 414]|nr:hypothetical protein FRC10_010395 [Ceratobasidium sp. 414]
MLFFAHNPPTIGLGACGWYYNISHCHLLLYRGDKWVAAISHELYPNNNPALTVDITYGGKTIRVGIVDRCEGCSLWDADISPSAFKQAYL